MAGLSLAGLVRGHVEALSSESRQAGEGARLSSQTVHVLPGFNKSGRRQALLVTSPASPGSAPRL